MLQFPAFAYLMVFFGDVAFGYSGFKGCVRLARTFRSLPRPSSLLMSQAIHLELFFPSFHFICVGCGLCMHDIMNVIQARDGLFISVFNPQRACCGLVFSQRFVVIPRLLQRVVRCMDSTGVEPVASRLQSGRSTD